MSCKKCQEDLSIFHTEYTPDETFPEIVLDGENFFPEKSYNTNTGIIKCPTCHALWFIEEKAVYFDPRDSSGPPPRYEVNARILDLEETRILHNPSLENLLRISEKTFFYGFIEDYLSLFTEDLSHTLISYYEANQSILMPELSRPLAYWYEQHNGDALKTQWENSHPGSSILYQLDEHQRLLALEVLDTTKTLLVLEQDEEYQLLALDTQSKAILWQEKVPRFYPWMHLINPLIVAGNRIITIHLDPEENGPYIYRPNLIQMRDFEGKLLYEQALSWHFYEKSAFDSDGVEVNQGRIIHNFRLSIINDLLFFAHQDLLIAVSLSSGEIIMQTKFKNHELFTGKVYLREDGFFLAELYHGWVLLNPDLQILPENSYLGKPFPVFISPSGNLLYQNGTFFNPISNESIELTELYTYPLFYSDALFIAESEGITILSDDNEILGKVPFSVLQSFENADTYPKQSPFLISGYALWLSSEEEIILLHNQGKVRSRKKFDGFPVAMGPVSDHLFYIFLFHSEKSVALEQYEVRMLDLDFKVVKQMNVLNPELFSFDSRGNLIIYENFQYDEAGSIRLIPLK